MGTNFRLHFCLLCGQSAEPAHGTGAGIHFCVRRSQWYLLAESRLCRLVFRAAFSAAHSAEMTFPSASFAVMYALCSYILGYYWNIIWLDTVALLPLVVLGLVYLVRDGKCQSLCGSHWDLSLFTNFYIGMFTCIFRSDRLRVACACAI